MELKRISLIGIICILAISLYLPNGTFACWTESGYKVDCCFINPTEKGEYCCKTIEDCCAEGFENCERNTWREDYNCPCGDSSCNDPTPTTSCPTTTSSIPSATTTTPTFTTTCPPEQGCGDECCSSGYVCCNRGCCEGDFCCTFGGCCDDGQKCCWGKCCKDHETCMLGFCFDTEICWAFTFFGEDSEEVKLLREYRDKVLSKSPVGREIIRLHYQWSPVIVEAMKADEGLQKELQEMLEKILPLVREAVE